MRIPFLSLFMTSPLEDMEEHAQKVKDYAWAFQQAIECFLNDKCTDFEEHRHEILKIETEADAIKRRIRGHMPKSLFMPVNKLQVLIYLKKQNDILVRIREALEWLPYRGEDGIPESLKKDFYLLVDASIEPIEELSNMVTGAHKFFNKFSEKRRASTKKIIAELRQKKKAAKRAEDLLNQKIFTLDSDSSSLLHLAGLSEKIGKISDQAEDAADIMLGLINS